MSFRFRQYEDLIKMLRDEGYQFLTVNAALLKVQNKESLGKVVIMRHDVDRFPYKSVYFSSYEEKLGIKSSYFFRASKSRGFPVDAINNITACGHDAGYHYENLARCNGNIKLAKQDFIACLENFRKTTECRSVCMHGSPLKSYNNIDLITDEIIAQNNLIGDAVLGFDGLSIAYLTDTGGIWNTGKKKRNFRDSLSTRSSDFDARRVEHFLEKAFVKGSTVYINTHPERWSRSFRGYLLAKSIDFGVNVIKLCLIIFSKFKAK